MSGGCWNYMNDSAASEIIQARLLERGLAYNPYCTKQEGL